ncbi:MAG: Lrp/AsnC family transcriptional regulator [archaeon]
MAKLQPVKEKDLKILRELKKDARQSTAEIGRTLSIPRVTVHERIQRLASSGVIRKFTIEPDYALLGKPVKAFILLGYSPNQKFSQRQLIQALAKIDEVSEVSLLAGDWDILLKVRTESIDALGKLVVDQIRALPGVGKSVTMPALTTEKEEL